MRKIGCVWLCSKRFRNVMKRTAVIRPSTTMNRNYALRTHRRHAD